MTTNHRHYVAVYFVKQLGGILPKALVSVVKYGCMYQYKVGGVSQKNSSQAIAWVVLHLFKLLADLN